MMSLSKSSEKKTYNNGTRLNNKCEQVGYEKTKVKWFYGVLHFFELSSITLTSGTYEDLGLWTEWCSITGLPVIGA